MMVALIAAGLIGFAGAESKADEEFKGLDAAAKRKIRVAVVKMKAEGVPAQKRDPVGAVAEQFKIDRETVKMVVEEKVEPATGKGEMPPTRKNATEKPSPKEIKIKEGPVTYGESFSKVNKQTTCNVHYAHPRSPISFFVSFGTRAKRFNETLNFMISGPPESRLLQGIRTMTVETDGKTFKFQAVDYSVEKWSESLLFAIHPEDLKAISESEYVKFTIGEITIEPVGNFRPMLKRLLQRFEDLNKR